jgi:hypothetical protein
MDEAQRNIAATLGVGLMLGAIAWASTVSTSGSHPLLLRLVLPVGMFVLGALIVVWAWRSPSQPRRLLAKAIADGHVVLGIADYMTLVLHWKQWQPETYEMLREHLGLAVAQDFANSSQGVRGQDVRAWVRAEVEFLEGLRKRRRGR